METEMAVKRPAADKRAMSSRQQKVYLETHGCQMNVRDTETILGLLEARGWGFSPEPEGADLILVNTCSIRDRAEQKTYSELGKYRLLKAENPDLLVAMAGCVAQQAGAEALARVKGLDLVLGTHNIHELPDMIDERRRTGQAIVRANFSYDDEKIFQSAVRPSEKKVAAFVNISIGCDHKCTYCIVPVTRGAEMSRRSADIVAEIRGLVADGVREVTLLGQNVNSYGKQFADEASFGELIRLVAKIDGLERIRFTTSHPVDVKRDLIDAFADEPKLMSHVHLPVQSGSDRILRRMKREYNRERYLEVVGWLREARPDVALTTDFITGFPGETEADFAETMSLLEEVRFDSIYSFAYSPRPGTPALKLDEFVDPEVANERLLRLQKRANEIADESLDRFVGKSAAVLFEGKSKQSDTELTGRTPENITVNVPAPEWRIGRTAEVRISRRMSHTLRGELVREGEAAA